MITLADLKDFLKQWGISLPDSVLQCIVDDVNGAYDCLINGGVSECNAKLALLTAASLIVWGFAGRTVKSIGLKGLSKSWTDQDLADIQNSLRSNLSLFDPNGCLSDKIPADPTANSYFAVVKGTKCR